MQLSPATEDNILTLLCWSDHANEVAIQITADLFSTRAYQKIAAKALEYITKFNVAPKAHIRDLLESDLERAGEESKFLKRIIDAVETLQAELQPEYVLNQLTSFIISRKLSDVLARAADALQSGEIDKVYEIISEPQVENNGRMDAGVYLKDTEKWVSLLKPPQEEDKFSCGIGILDDFGVVPKTKEAYLFMAPSGRGKSWWAHEVGKVNTIERRKSVLHISLENDLEVVISRYTQSLLVYTKDQQEALRTPFFKRDSLGRFADLDFNEKIFDSIQTSSLGSIATKLQPFQRRGKLLVKWFPMRTLTVAYLNSYLTFLEKTYNFIPDLVIIDSINLMHIDTRNYRIAIGAIYQELRALAGIRNFALVATTQSNRQSVGAKVVTSSMVGEDWSLIQTSDNVITYSRTPEEKELGLARILVDKSRNNQDRWMALITQSYATGQFCIDSVYFNKFVQGELLRHTGEDNDDD